MAHALYRSTFLESWGSGIRRIIEACREQGVEEPTWRWDGAFVYVTFKRPVKHGSNIAQVQSKQDDEPLNHRSTTAQPSINGQIQSSPEMNEVHQKTNISSPESSLETIISSPEFNNSSSDQKVLMLLNHDSRLTLDKIAEYLNMTKRGVQKITNRLQQSGAISRKGANKNGEWVVNKES